MHMFYVQNLTVIKNVLKQKEHHKAKYPVSINFFIFMYRFKMHHVANHYIGSILAVSVINFNNNKDTNSKITAATQLVSINFTHISRINL